MHQVNFVKDILNAYVLEFPPQYRGIVSNIYWHPLNGLVPNLELFKNGEHKYYETYKIKFRPFTLLRNNFSINLLENLSFSNLQYWRLGGFLSLRSCFAEVENSGTFDSFSLGLDMIKSGYRSLRVKDTIRYIEYVRNKLAGVKQITSSLSRYDSFQEVFILGVAVSMGIEVILHQHGAMYETDFGFGPDYFINKICSKYFTYFDPINKCKAVRYSKWMPLEKWTVKRPLTPIFICPNFANHVGITPCISSRESINLLHRISYLADRYQGFIFPPRDEIFKINSKRVLPRSDIKDLISKKYYLVIFDLSSIFYEVIFARMPFICILDEKWNLKPAFLEKFSFLIYAGAIRFNEYLPEIDEVFTDDVIERLERVRSELF